MLHQFYLMLASPSSLTLEVRVMFFELCVHDGQALVRRAMLSSDSSCLAPLYECTGRAVALPPDWGDDGIGFS